MSALVFESVLSTPAMLAVFDAPAVVQAMLDVEAARVRAQAAEGSVPPGAAQAIAGVCKAELFDVPAIVAAGARAGSLAIPLVQRLAETVALFDAEAAVHVPAGSTGSGLVDTAMALLARRALALIDRDLTRVIEALLVQAREYDDAPLLARTPGRPARITSWGCRRADWIAPLLRCQQRLREAGARALQLQPDDAADALAARMAQSLQLALPAGVGQHRRDEAMRLQAEVGILCAVLGSLAKDWSLLAQPELGELAEPGQAGGMPTASLRAGSAALRAPQRVAALLGAMLQAPANGLGSGQTEQAEAAGLYLGAHAAVAALAEAAAAMRIDPARMLHNIETQRGTARTDGPSPADAAASAQALAGPELAVLAEQARQQAAAPPWAAFLPTAN